MKQNHAKCLVTFLPSLDPIGQVVFKKTKLMCEKLKNTDNENKVGHKVMTLPHMDIWVNELIKQVHQYHLS